MDAEDPEPALEINHELTAKLPEELLKRDLKQGKLGPPIIKHNVVSAVVLDASARRVYVGMQHGDVFFWDLRCYRNHLHFGSHSAHRAMGSHKGCVTALCTLRTSSAINMPLVASGSADRTICLWDPKRGTSVEPAVLVQTLYKHGGTVTAVMAYNAYLLSASTDRTVRLWQASAGRQQLLYPAFEQVRVIACMPAWVTALSSQGEQFEAGKDNAVYAADTQANILRIEACRDIGIKHDVDACRMVTDEALTFTVADSSGSSGCEVQSDTGGSEAPPSVVRAVTRMQDRGVLFTAFNRDHCVLVTGSWDNCLRVWDTARGELLATFVNEHAVVYTAAVYDVRTRQIVTIDKLGYLALYCPAQVSMLASKRVSTLDTVGLQQVAATDVYMVVSTHDVAFWRINRDVDYNVGQIVGEADFRVFSASADNTVRLWDPIGLACLQVYTGSPSEIATMLFYEAWNIVVTGHEGGEVVLWDCNTETQSVLSQHSNTVSAMDMGVVFKDVELLMTGSFDGTIGLWDIRTMPGATGQKPHLLSRWTGHGSRDEGAGIETGCLPPRHTRPEIRCLMFHPQLRLLLSAGNDCRIKVWDLANNQLLGELLTHSEAVTCFAFEGYFVFSGSEDCRVCVWDLQSVAAGRRRHTLDLEAADPKGVVTVREPLYTLLGHDRTVTALSILPQTGDLLSCGLDGRLIFWDYVTRAQLRKFEHAEEMLCMAVRVDTDEVLVGTREGNILRFDARELEYDTSSLAAPSGSGGTGLL